MLLRELVGGDPPYMCKLVFRDDPAGFGHRVTDGGRVTEHIMTQAEEFERAVAAKVAEGFAETERSLTRRVFATADRFWIVALDADTLRTQSGGIGVNWRESSGQTRDKGFRDRDRAVAAYHRAIADKQTEGYREQFARTVVIADIPKTPKKPGKRKSR